MGVSSKRMPGADKPYNEADSDRFATTRWSMVLAASGGEAADVHAALSWLCERYWFPLYAFVRRKGSSVEEAEDLVQAFFTRLLEQKPFAGADAKRGRFRSYLLGCLNRFLADEWRRAQAIKRGARLHFVSLHDEDAEHWLQRELATSRTPEQDYDRAWALALLDRVLEVLRTECEEDGHGGRFVTLRPFLDGNRSELALADAAKMLRLSLPALKSVVHRLRQRLRELIRGEIRETVQTETEVEDELVVLFSALKS
jgi:RNA polymerase sigma-70 factor (ECF subfamily)